MGTRDQVYGSVSSLVVRPSDSEGGGGNDYEPGEIRREEPRRANGHGRAYDRAAAGDRLPPSSGEGLPTVEQPISWSVFHVFRTCIAQWMSYWTGKNDVGYDMKGYKTSGPTGSDSPLRHRKVEPYAHDYDRNGRDFDRGGRDFDRGARDFDRGGRDFDRGRRDIDRGGRDFDRGGRDFDHDFDRGRDFDRGGHDFSRDFDRGVDNHRGGYRGRGFRGGRGRGRFRDRSPPSGIGRGRPPLGRGFSGPGYGPSSPFRGESIGRNNPNVTPREGDWICTEPTCGNLNFARRTHCNNCNKPRRDMAPFGIGGGSPSRGFQGPPMPHLPPMGGPPAGRGMGRGGSGFGEPPIGWGRGGPRDFDQGPPSRPGERFPEFRPGRDVRDKPDYRDHDDYRERDKFDRGPPVDWGFPIGSRDREREDRFHDKRGPPEARSDRRPPSPPPRSRWGRDARERSRSPIRASSKDYYREPHLDRRRDDKRGGRRDRLDDAY